MQVTADVERIAAVVESSGAASECAAGWANAAAVVSGSPTATAATGAIGGRINRLFDLASVTKPMTAVAFARSGISRETTLGALLPEVRGTASAHVPIELLLAHRAGLLDHMPIYLPLVGGGSIDRDEALRAASNGRRDDAKGAPPRDGFAPVYSDLGYALVGAALARATGARDAGEAIAALVVRPLGLEDQLGTARELATRGVDVAERAAPTEDVTWRGGVLRGRVHDENAWALTGEGGSGHAGMFGTIEAVLKLGLHVSASRDLDWLHAPRPGGTLRAGFDGKSETGSSAGSVCGPRTYGHLGFTGTSLWIDPDARAVVALLTNRVYPTRNNTAIREARPRAHDALFTLARDARPQPAEGSMIRK
jgi:CubicO group peptidase (beta-lactamase class C family)